MHISKGSHTPKHDEAQVMRESVQWPKVWIAGYSFATLAAIREMDSPNQLSITDHLEQDIKADKKIFNKGGKNGTENDP